MSAFLLWWRERSLREQRLLAVMIALIAVVIAWLAVVRPLGDALADARRGHAEAVIAAARADAQAAAIRALEREAPRRPAMPLASRVAASASDAGLTISPSSPRPDMVAVAIDAVRPTTLFGWTARLESREGAIVETLKARANPDRTLSVRLTLRERGG